MAHPEGFTPWAGGECPVADDAVVDVIFANGNTCREAAGALSWDGHERATGWSVAAYRVHGSPDDGARFVAFFGAIAGLDDDWFERFQAAMPEEIPGLTVDHFRAAIDAANRK